MSDHLKRENLLRQLLEDNFVLAKQSRRIRDIITDPSLKKYFQNLSSRHNQFAIELREEINFYGGQVPYIPPPAFERNWKELSAGSIKKLLKKSYKLHKKAMRDYRTALSQINDGSCREIFIRHKARFENMLFELKSLKTLLSFRKEDWKRQEQET